jgi:pre-mRNA-splicing regulator WTAP
MAKCRMLLQENEELGRTVSSGRLAKLEGDIALHKKLILEMKNSEKGKIVH